MAKPLNWLNEIPGHCTLTPTNEDWEEMFKGWAEKEGFGDHACCVEKFILYVFYDLKEEHESYRDCILRIVKTARKDNG